MRSVRRNSHCVRRAALCSAATSREVPVSMRVHRLSQHRSLVTSLAVSTSAVSHRHIFTSTRLLRTTTDDHHRQNVGSSSHKKNNDQGKTSSGVAGTEEEGESVYPDYFFDLHPHDTAANAASPAPEAPSPSAVPPPPPPPPPSTPSQPADISAEDWTEFQQYLQQVDRADPDFLAYAQGYTPPVVAHAGTEMAQDSRAELLDEVAHLLMGSNEENNYGGDSSAALRDPYRSTNGRVGPYSISGVRRNGNDDAQTSSSPSLATQAPPMAMEDVEELTHDLAEEEEAREEEGQGFTEEDPSAPLEEDAHRSGEIRSHGDVGSMIADGELTFGDDAAADEELLRELKGKTVRLQNVADTVTPPLRIPDKDGRVAANFPFSSHTAARSVPHSTLSLDIPTVHMLSTKSYLVQQDRQYLAPRTPPEAQLHPPPSLSHSSSSSINTPPPRQCVLVVFSSNDLRVHDNHLLALASVRARTALDATGQPLPVIAVCVLDYRTFAQPSVVGGFFRQSPQRARFLLDTVAALRTKLEQELQVPLLIRCGRPEEHVPRLAAELGATDVFMTTQYAPHERRVQALLFRRLRKGQWVSREDVSAEALAEVADDDTAGGGIHRKDDLGVREDEADDPLVAVVEHDSAQTHPYGHAVSPAAAAAAAPQPTPPVVHSVWQTTLVHLDDLPTPLAAMKEGERWYHDDVTVSTIRPTEPYDKATQQLAGLPLTWQQAALLPPREEVVGTAAPSVLRGSLPTLEDLGYATAAVSGTDFAFEEVIATQSSHPDAGEEAALTRMDDWLADGGMTSLLRYGRERRTNVKLYSQKLARVSPYIAVGALSPRKYYEVLRQHAHATLRDGFVQQQFREGVLRLSRRDFWHWMGLRYGDRLFFSYGPHPEQTDDVPDWRHDAKVVQRWCTGLTGIPFADAAMRELLGTGFVAHEGRQALAWLLARGYGQDWRLGAEWMERCSLDYDPFVCYGNFAYSCGLIQDDFGEPMRNVHYLAHHHDQTGIYIKKWLPQLSKVPPVYIHRPHVLTPRMQAMHGVYLGRNYPYPLKLWQGAQRSLSAEELTAYFADGITKGPGYAEAIRYGAAVLPPEEFSAAVTPAYVQPRAWAATLPASAFADVDESAALTGDVFALAPAATAAEKTKRVAGGAAV